jgi:hypothetical protein
MLIRNAIGMFVWKFGSRKRVAYKGNWKVSIQQIGKYTTAWIQK